jgi:hypothetical protein
MRMTPGTIRKLEVGVAIMLTIAAVFLHLKRVGDAGGLWRDEAAAVGLAQMPTIREVVKYFPHEAFPLLVPMTLRAVTSICGGSETGFRVFGMLVGVGILGALWWNMKVVRRNVPLLSLALLGFNGALIQWGDSLRGYGLGTLMLLLGLGALWKVLERPTLGNSVVAALVAIASVQTLFHNPPLLLAICLGGWAVTMRRAGQWEEPNSTEKSRVTGKRETIIVLIIGVVAAASLLPYWVPLSRARAWDVMVRSRLDFWGLWTKLGETLGASGWSNLWVWAVLFVVAMVVWWRAMGREPWRFWGLGRSEHADDVAEGRVPGDSREREVLWFSGTALLFGLLGCIAFLTLLSYHPRPWYYLAFLALAALLLDFIFDTARSAGARVTRLLLAIVVAVSSFPLALTQTEVRQTNIDLVAEKLTHLAGKEDYVVVAPWTVGISFQRYYRGGAFWTTMPPMEFLKFHRYDLLQAKMSSTNADVVIGPALKNIQRTLERGHRVWIVGEPWTPEPWERPSDAKAAACLPARFGEVNSPAAWSQKVWEVLQAHSREMRTVPLDSEQPVFRLENLPVRVVEGRAAVLSEADTGARH